MPTRVHRPTKRLATVVDLNQFRERLQLSCYRVQLEEKLALHRAALKSLFDSGLVYTRHGSRVARELLQAQQMLMRAKDLVASEARLPSCGEAVLAKLRGEIDTLVARAGVTATRHKKFFS